MESYKSIYKIPKSNILASQRYTKSNPDPNPPTIISDPHKIGQISKNVVGKLSLAKVKSSEDFIPRVHSFSERLDSLQDIEFDVHFEQSLFCSKSLSWIDKTVVDSSVPLYNPIEDLFSHNKSGSQLVHTLDHL